MDQVAGRAPAAPSIAVALATYNGQGFLQQQLDSIARQRLLPSELVVTDDNSSDDTADIVRQFTRTAPFPVHLHCNSRRLGYRGNFMRALSLCRAELVALCDQDDVWDPGKLAVAAAAFDDPETVLFYHDAWLVDREGRRLGPADIYHLPASNPPLSVHSLGRTPFGFSIVCRRSLLQFSDLWERSVDSYEPEHPMAHDQWLFFLASVFGAIATSDHRLTDYRQHGGNAYGAPSHSLGSKLRHWLRWRTNHGPKYRTLAEVARVRAAILSASQARLEGVWRDRAVRGEQACLRLADRLALRARLYGNASITERARLVLRLHRHGAYHADSGFGLGREVLVKDIAFGILLQRFLGALHR